MKEVINSHKLLWAQKGFFFSVLFGLALFIASLFINYFAGTYATLRASNSVRDILLDNIPAFNVDLIFVNGFYVFIFFVVGLLIYTPKALPFVLKASALFVLVRSFFITLTHIGPSPLQIVISSSAIFDTFSFVGDLFFSGHTGLPFLLSLIFWQNIYLRLFFVLSSVVFGAAVILGHLHYSIDVFGAFFITYTIFHVARHLFSKDYRRLEPAVVISEKSVS
jgi:hypothetical protein